MAMTEGSHVAKAKAGISTLIKTNERVSDRLDDLKKMIEEIPGDFGQRDELGSNVEDYLNTIIRDYDSGLVQPIENILSNGNSFIKEAERRDQSALREAANERIVKETTSSSPNRNPLRQNPKAPVRIKD